MWVTGQPVSDQQVVWVPAACLYYLMAGKGHWIIHSSLSPSPFGAKHFGILCGTEKTKPSATVKALYRECAHLFYVVLLQK